jgi:Thioredoxin-like [2Fe-2S] ferredoxin
MLATTSAQTNAFEYAGQFGGFFRDFFGNQRMVLRTGGDELFLGVTAPLRTRLAKLLAPGQEIVVAGKTLTGTRVTELVSHAWIEGQPVSAGCIRVCSKKKCWRAGGKEIWDTLNGYLPQSELGQCLKLETVHCLDNCKHGPNLEFDGSLVQHCTTKKAVELLKAPKNPIPLD